MIGEADLGVPPRQVAKLRKADEPGKRALLSGKDIATPSCRESVAESIPTTMNMATGNSRFTRPSAGLVSPALLSLPGALPC
jgi:hypothetical protein